MLMWAHFTVTKLNQRTNSWQTCISINQFHLQAQLLLPRIGLLELYFQVHLALLQPTLLMSCSILAARESDYSLSMTVQAVAQRWLRFRLEIPTLMFG